MDQILVHGLLYPVIAIYFRLITQKIGEGFSIQILSAPSGFLGPGDGSPVPVQDTSPLIFSFILRLLCLGFLLVCLLRYPRNQSGDPE